MRDSVLKLKEKTVALVGPLSPVTQSLASSLVEMGADVALVTSDGNHAQRFVNNLMDLREARQDYGRSAPVEKPLNSEAEAKDAISRVAELFGSLDIYIDTRLLSTTEADAAEMLSSIKMMSNEVMGFLKGRGKGRLIYLVNSANLLGEGKNSPNVATQNDLRKFTHELAQQVPHKNITVNSAALAVTEEYLLSRFPKSASIQAGLEEIKKNVPKAKLVNAIDVANIVVFMASPMSSAITGQTINVDHGL